jgi:hypothetical protein
MIKVRHSKSKRVLLLDFSGAVNTRDLQQAEVDIERALRDIGKGYTLVEVFRNHPCFEAGARLVAGEVVGTCYKNSRIWRVIRLEDVEYADPGVAILHRTRWRRDVPELTMDNIREAVAVAKEESAEQAEWWEGGNHGSAELSGRQGFPDSA